uniref:Uncharacterized protein n=1 Tax=Nothobranchius furzeri TaxID=105023 RepID=A0A8C6W0D7_NOTFU
MIIYWNQHDSRWLPSLTDISKQKNIFESLSQTIRWSSLLDYQHLSHKILKLCIPSNTSDVSIFRTGVEKYCGNSAASSSIYSVRCTCVSHV